VLVSVSGGVAVHTRLQTIFNMKFGDDVKRSIHEIIVTHAVAAERLGPGGFDLCIERLLEKFVQYRRGFTPPGASVILEGLVRSGASIPTRDDVEWALGEYLSNASDMTVAMVRQALELAGFAGRIVVEKARLSPSVELVRGYTFDQAPAWPISVRLERPRVVCVDGFVEEVSELHHLLEAAAEAKEPVLLFVRGMSDDVRNTLRVNYDRGSLRVVPIVVKFDIEGINALNDVAVACGSELVSSLKGDLINGARLHAAPRVDEAVVHPARVAVSNFRSRRAVEAHVAFLRRKRLDEKVDEVAMLFDSRIKSLSPNHVVIRLPDDKDYVVAAQAIDYALRAVKALVDHGTVTMGARRMLTTSALASEVHSDRCLATLLTLGAVVRP
jgi:chaperonin GroEL (HSP60 family)